MLDYEIEELACYACGLNEAQTEDAVNNYKVDEIVYEKFGVDQEQFTEIIKALLEYTPIVESAFGRKKYHAFCKGSAMIVRREVKE